MSSANIAVILSGCGFLDGAEINESVLTLLHIEEAGAQYQCFAPDQAQHHCVNHAQQSEQNESRNVLQESARITRGNIQTLEQLDPTQFDALILPGGFGVAKNLCDFAFAGENMTVNELLLSKAQAFYQTQKPIGLICIAPVLAPHIIGKAQPPVEVTIGNDADTAKALETMGAVHVNCSVEQALTDSHHRIVTTPAYMLATNVSESSAGIRALVQEVTSLL